MTEAVSLSRKFLQHNLIGVQFWLFLLKTEYCFLQERAVEIHVEEPAGRNLQFFIPKVIRTCLAMQDQTGSSVCGL